jgi:hypothetical protein
MNGKRRLIQFTMVGGSWRIGEGGLEEGGLEGGG